MAYRASKPITLFGDAYKPGDSVPAERLERVRRETLVKQRTIEYVPDPPMVVEQPEPKRVAQPAAAAGGRGK